MTYGRAVVLRLCRHLESAVGSHDRVTHRLDREELRDLADLERGLVIATRATARLRQRKEIRDHEHSHTLREMVSANMAVTELLGEIKEAAA